MDIFFDKLFLKSIPDKYINKIDHKLEMISQYSINQFRKSNSCRKIKSCNDIYKFRFSRGDRIVFMYITNGIHLIKYATHDKQIKIAERYNRIKNTITSNMIKWSNNAIALLLNVVNEKNGSKEEINIDSSEQIYESIDDVNLNEEYIEDETDETIDKEINELIESGILSNDLEKVRELYLKKEDINNAIFYDEIINISEKREFFTSNVDKISCIEINKNTNGQITYGDIKTAIDIVYDQYNVYLYPIFSVHVQLTGIYEIFCLPTENKKQPSRNKEQIISKINKDIGEIKFWGNIIIECLLYSTKTNSLLQNIWLDVFPALNSYMQKDYHGDIKHNLNKYGYAINIDTSSNERGNKIFSNRKLIQSKEDVLKDNLNFIFNK